MKNLIKISSILLVSCSSVYGLDYYWNASGGDKTFSLSANWNPQVNPQAMPTSATSLGELMVSNYSTFGAAEINSNLTVNFGTINAGGIQGNSGVINIRSGNISCNRIQAGMRYGFGIVNIYGGAMQINGISTRIDTTGALRAYYGGIINFYGGTVEMDYAFWLSTDTTFNFYNAGGHAKAPNAIYAPIYAKKGVDSMALKVTNGKLNVYLSKGLNLAINDVIYLIEYNAPAITTGFKNVSNNQEVVVDGFRFRLEMNKSLGDGRYAVALVALQAVDTRLPRGTVIMLSQNCDF